MTSPYTTIMLNVEFTALSPVIDNPSFNMVYQAGAFTPAFADVPALLTSWVTKFTTTQTGQTINAAGYIGVGMSRNTNSSLIRAYDISNHLDGTPHGAPVATQSFTLTSAGAVQPLAEGVCLVITLQAAYGSDVEFAPGARPRARDRGRIYFGPLNANAQTEEGTTNRCIPTSAIKTDLTKWIQACNTLTAAGADTYSLGVWSRKNAGVKTLVECSVDDRFDYQRRRADQGATKLIQTLP